MDIRAVVQRILDEIQFRYDVFPRLLYQPLPWLGLNSARRGVGTKQRWKAMEAALATHSIRSAMDIGCNVGYFCFALSLKGIPTLGIELNDQFYRTALYASRRLKTSNVGLCNMEVGAQTVHLLPNTDLVLLLSVWHHWVRINGLDCATELLSTVWDKCGQVMFFETGEDEMPERFGLPVMTPSPQEWLRQYLGRTCANSTVTEVGRYKAFAPGGDEGRNVSYRSLFMVTRQGTTSQAQV